MFVVRSWSVLDILQTAQHTQCYM